MTNTPPVSDVVCHLRRLLESIGDALVAGRIDPLLAAERELGPALHALSSVHRSAAERVGDSRQLRDELLRCRAALERCRRLGASFQALAGAALEATGRAGAYTRGGDAPPVPPAAGLQVRG